MSSPPPAPPTPPAPAPAPALSARDKKLATLTAANATLEAELAALRSAHAEASRRRLLTQRRPASDTVRRHIHLLHEYNEVRDVALGLMGLVAENRGVTVGAVMKELGVADEKE